MDRSVLRLYVRPSMTTPSSGETVHVSQSFPTVHNVADYIVDHLWHVTSSIQTLLGRQNESKKDNALVETAINM